ncbi:hypothetical protein EST38_g7530 [Candolleomyces aberdarensis]|uniref:Uncharacterized protein n=1 Tax=Candolleomyces aberdarensis TaxID=2316362 RepID=A0A4Q2DEW3_9AGAR|nr:hypothetical protein EST38_g7530 [Candolleomyces aberdarensis]
MTITDFACDQKGRVQSEEMIESLFIHEFTVLPEPPAHPSSKKSFLKKYRLWPSNKKPAKPDTDTIDKQMPASYGPNHWSDRLQVQSHLPPRPDDLDTLPNVFTDSRLSMLTLSNKGPFGPFLFPSLYNLAIRSSTTLTRLHFSNCRLVAYDWHGMLSSWRFPQLSHFSIRDSRVPFPVLISFFQAHPTLTAVTLLVHELVGTVRILYEDDLLPNLHQLVAAPALLIPILSTVSPSSTSPKTQGRLLPSLETLTISQEHNFAQDSWTAVRFHEMSAVLSLLASRPRTTGSVQLPRLRTLAIRTMYPAQQCFQGWLRNVAATAAPPAADTTPSASSSKQSGSARPVSYSSMQGITQFQISSHEPGWEAVDTAPTMRVDPHLVVDAISSIFCGSTDLRTVMITDIFTGCSGQEIDDTTGEVVWREKDEFPPAIGRLWESCEGLEEVRLPGMASIGVEELWRRPTST